MTRARLAAAVIAAAALTLAGCSNAVDGAATTGDSTAVQAADTPNDAATEPSAEESAESTEQADVITDESDAETTMVAAGDLDTQSAAWFNEFCEIGAPFDEFFGSIMGAASVGMGGEDTVTVEQLADARDTLAGAFRNLGDAMSGVGTKLANVPAPTIANGAEIAANVVEGLQKAGPYLAAAADKMESVSATTVAEFNAQMEATMDSMDDINDTLDLGEVELDDNLKAAVAKLPNCAGTMMFDNPFDE